MGHVVSFVILCMANVIAYWTAVEHYREENLTLKRLKRDWPVLVNGDDILFRCCDDDFYAKWMETIRKFGFDPSVGKNFISDKFLQVNSEMWRIDTRFSLSRGMIIKDLVKIPYVNFGLITNRRKNDCSKDLSVRCHELAPYMDVDTLLGRLKTLPAIQQKVLEGMPRVLVKPVQKLLKDHQDPMLREFGLLPLFKQYGNLEGFTEMYGGIVKNVKKEKETLLYPLFSELSGILDRGELEFSFDRVRELERTIKHNPFSLWSDSLFPAEKEIEWKAC
jgi:hypothetical protein